MNGLIAPYSNAAELLACAFNSRINLLGYLLSKCGRTKEKDDGKFTPATVVRYARLLVSILPGR